MKTLLVVAHPRKQSLTAQVAGIFADTIQANGHEPEWADLVEEGFDPVMREADEPDWDDPRKRYSEPVLREMARIERNQALVMVFPVYWWSVPAILKGWIDRVWNHGWAYGDRSLPLERVWMIGIAGSGAVYYGAEGYDSAMRAQLEAGTLAYCGVAERRLELLYGAIEGGAKQVLTDAVRLAADF